MTGFGDFLGLMRNAKDMMAKAKGVQDDLARRTAAGSSGAGLVTARVNGLGDLIGLEIDRVAVNPDETEMLADLIVAAVAEARKKAQALRADAMRNLAGGVDLSALGLDPGSLM